MKAELYRILAARTLGREQNKIDEAGGGSPPNFRATNLLTLLMCCLFTLSYGTQNATQASILETRSVATFTARSISCTKHDSDSGQGLTPDCSTQGTAC